MFIPIFGNKSFNLKSLSEIQKTWFSLTETCSGVAFVEYL